MFGFITNVRKGGEGSDVCEYLQVQIACCTHMLYLPVHYLFVLHNSPHFEIALIFCMIYLPHPFSFAGIHFRQVNLVRFSLWILHFNLFLRGCLFSTSNELELWSAIIKLIALSFLTNFSATCLNEVVVITWTLCSAFAWWRRVADENVKRLCNSEQIRCDSGMLLRILISLLTSQLVLTLRLVSRLRILWMRLRLIRKQMAASSLFAWRKWLGEVCNSSIYGIRKTPLMDHPGQGSAEKPYRRAECRQSIDILGGGQ